MTRPGGGTPWHLRLAAAAALMSATACGGTAASVSPGQTTPATQAPPSLSLPPSATPPPGAVAASKGACGLISDGDAAAALGLAVGQAQPVPPVNLHNGAVGGTCEWTDSAGGTVLVITLKYPSPAIARKVFTNSKSSAASAQPVRLPDLAPLEFGDTGAYGSTRIAESFLLDGNRELNVTINESTSGPGSKFSLQAFVTLVEQAARAWRS